MKFHIKCAHHVVHVVCDVRWALLLLRFAATAATAAAARKAHHTLLCLPPRAPLQVVLCALLNPNLNAGMLQLLRYVRKASLCWRHAKHGTGPPVLLLLVWCCCRTQPWLDVLQRLQPGSHTLRRLHGLMCKQPC